MVEFLAVCAVLSLAPLLGGSLHWLLELTSVLTLHFLTLAAFATALAAWRRRWLLAALLAFVTSVHVVTTWRVRPREAMPPRAEAVSMLVANVHTGNQEYARVVELIEKFQPEIVGLLEINHAWHTALARSLKSYPFQLVRSREDNFGIGLFSRRPWSNAKEESHGPAPTLSAGIPVGERQIRLVLAHVLPPLTADYAEERDRELRRIAVSIRRSKRPTVLVGDLNATQFSRSFQGLLQRGRLVDRGDLRGTWTTAWPALLRLRLDHVLATRDVAVTSRIGPAIGSDHLPLLIRFGPR